MITNELQKRIREGDREAFKTVYAQYGREVYLNAMGALNDAEAARAAVKQTFLNLLGEIMRAEQDIDLVARIDSLAENELLIRRIIADGGAAKPAREQPEGAREGRAPVRPEAALVSEPAAETGAQEAPDESEPTQEADELPPLTRARAYMHVDGEAEAPEQPKAAEGGNRANPVVTLLAIAFAALLVWVLAGIAMDFSLIPRVDLGYRWFNETIFRLFNV